MYEPLPDMQTLNFAIEGGLEFLNLPHRRPWHATSSTNFDHLEVGMEFEFKDSFAVVVKWYNIQLGDNLTVP